MNFSFLKARPCALALAVFSCLSSYANAQSFVVRDIRVEGLQRVSAGTVFNYLPVQVGEVFDLDDSAAVLGDLYAINLFSNLRLERDGYVLVVQVEEFPVIASVELKGNSSLSSSAVQEALADAGLAEGNAYNPVVLREMVDQLYQQYYANSKLQVEIEPKVESLPRGRVDIVLDIKEGKSAQFKAIEFVGNRVYSDKELRRVFDTRTPGWFTFLSKRDRFNQERQQADYERLEAFYHNRGFADFEIESVQYALSDDKTEIYLTVNVSEGEIYRFGDYRVSGDLVVSEAELLSLIRIRQGERYDRSMLEESVRLIENRLADEGYAKAMVELIENKDVLTREVSFDFVVHPNERINVRRIEFTGNNKTHDNVLRREMRQLEMAPYSASDIERSEQRVRRLPQVESLDKTLRDVPNYPDQVDIVYGITERSTSYIQGGVGYGQSSGALFTLEYADDNFLGMGNRFNINFGRGSYVESYGVSVTNPYFTDNGVSLRTSFNYDKLKYDKEDLSDWTSDNLSVFTTFGFPVSEYQTFYLGAGYRYIKIHTGRNVAQEILQEVDEYGDRYHEYVLNSSIVRDTTDDAYFPNSGAINSFSVDVTMPVSDSKYYRLDYSNRSYFSLNSNNSLVFSLHGNVSYGAGYGKNSNLPFYRRYYAGGMDTIRGYQYGSIGPRYSNNDYAGGDFRVVGGAELMTPLSFSGRESNLRFGVFLDAGSVWSRVSDFDTGDLRYSTGLFLQWMSPIGPLNLSYGVPLNKKEGDERESFQFTIGTTF